MFRRLPLLLWIVFALPFMVSNSYAASDVSNSGKQVNQAVTTDSAKQSSVETGSIIGDAISGGLSGAGASGGGATDVTLGAAPGPQRVALSGMSAGDETEPTETVADNIGIWIQGSYADIDRSEVGLELDGNLYVGVGGIDYQVTDRLLLGVAVSTEVLDLSTSFNNGSFDALGVSVIPYAGFKFNDTFSADIALGYGQVSYESARAENSTSPVYGEFDGERLFGTLGVTANLDFDEFVLRPRLSVIGLTEDQEAYTESNGTPVDRTTFDFGRSSLGTVVGYRFGNHIPYVRLRGDIDFKTEDSVLKANGQESYVGDYGGQIGFGYEYANGPLSINLSGSYDTVARDEIDVWTSTGRIRFEF